MATPRGKRTAPIMTAVPEVPEADREVIAGEPSTDGEKCGTCKGLGLVRAVGKNAGKPYRTLNGAQAAQEGGRATDCPSCKGTGLIGLAV